MKSFRLRFMQTLLMLTLVAAPISAHAQTFSVLYNFGTNTGDPATPYVSGVIAQGRDGKLYSTTDFGGDNGGLQDGAMFSIAPSGALTVPYSFPLPFEEAVSGLTLGTDGNFYGTTTQGGGGFGTVFKITPTGTLTVLHTFTDSDGSTPFAPPIQGTDGNFYGATTYGGANTLGAIYKITPAGTFTSLYSFDSTHGANPFGQLVQGTDGNFYGTASAGGPNPSLGVVYKITPAGRLTVIYYFDVTHGYQPEGPLVQGSDGSFYGTANGGGTIGNGVIFKITSTGTLTVLHNVNAATDGSTTYGALVQATDGNFYGTTNAGGSLGSGTIFKISPISPYTYTVVYNFDGTTGADPYAGLVQHTNGILYGDTNTGGTGTLWCNLCGTFYSLNIGAAPFLSPVSTSGKVGNTIEILGQGFTGTTGVSFNGKAAIFKVWSRTYLTASVPSGATTGFITVVTPGGTLKSNRQFRVKPQITSFTPSSGPVGTSVVITGASLTQTARVIFGSVRATTFTVNSDTQVTATVPTGAVTGNITIATAGGNVTSATSFTVTP
jgi:uncharacterized repeat protein (TIGR03803 family)